MGIVKVNRTGTAVSVYLTNACNPSDVIGTIYHNEVFTWTGEWSGSSASGYYVQGIKFRNSSGVAASGWIPGMQTDPIFSTNIASLCHHTVVKNGITHYAFKMRRDATCYDNSNGYSLGINAKKDRYILTRGSTSGVNHPDRIAVWFMESGINTGVYNYIVNNTYVFVDMGYTIGSTMGSDFTLIGSIG